MFLSFNGLIFISDNRTTILYDMGAADTNQGLWFCTNPYAGSLPHPKCKEIINASHTLLMFFYRLMTIFATDNRTTILYYMGVADTNQVLWFKANPSAGSLLHPNRLSKKHVFIKRHLIPHDEIGSTGQLVGKGLGGNSAICFSHFLLIKPLGFGNVPFGKVRCFNISPC